MRLLKRVLNLILTEVREALLEDMAPIGAELDSLCKHQ